MSLRIGLATLHAGRRAQLEAQAAAVARLDGLETYLAVSMDGSAPPPGAEPLRLAPAAAGRWPLAQARNEAIATLAGRCDLIVLLDADCIPDPHLLQRFASTAEQVDLARALLLAEVGWLDGVASHGRIGASARERARASAKRDFPPPGRHTIETRPELFWSLCFAVSPRTHARIGGFDEAYVGWGAEDTDYGRRAAAAGVDLWKVGDAWAYHQPHPPARRTSAEIDAVLANARRFRARWGDWPMPDVLAEIAARRAVTGPPGGG